MTTQLPAVRTSSGGACVYNTRRRHFWCKFVAPDVCEIETSVRRIKAAWPSPDASTFGGRVLLLIYGGENALGIRNIGEICGDGDGVGPSGRRV